MKWLLVAVLTSLTIFSALTQSHLLHGSPVNSLCADLIHPANYSCTEHSVQISSFIITLSYNQDFIESVVEKSQLYLVL